MTTVETPHSHPEFREPDYPLDDSDLLPFEPFAYDDDEIPMFFPVVSKVGTQALRDAFDPAAFRDGLHDYLETERTYDLKNTVIEPAPATAELTSVEIAERMETDHVVKAAPEWANQLRDNDRYGSIVRIDGQGRIGPGTHEAQYESRRMIHREHRAMQQTDEFLRAIRDVASWTHDGETYARAEDMLETLTYIGKKEYQEAAAGIATYWKSLLDHNPRLQLLVRGDEVSMRDEDMQGVKSDQYLFDTVLGNFTDQELKTYAGRLITDASQVTATESKDLRVLLLDDWTISGQQMEDATFMFIGENAHLEPSVEVQLLVASEERIRLGFRYDAEDSMGNDVHFALPVRAYYQAHYANKTYESDAHITGAHSSVDYDFEDDLAQMRVDAVHAARANNLDVPDVLRSLPPLANIVRPYRQPGYELRNVARLRAVSTPS